MRARLIPFGDGKTNLGVSWAPDRPEPNDAFLGWLSSLVRSVEGSIGRHELTNEGSPESVLVSAKREGSEVVVRASVEALALFGRLALHRLFTTCSLDELRIELERDK